MMRDAWLNLIVNSLSVELQELTAKEHDTSGNSLPLILLLNVNYVNRRRE